MEYESFIDEIRKMLAEYPENKMFVPTLGGQSLFLVYIQGSKLKIVNSECHSYLFGRNEYEAIKLRFEKSSAFAAFKTCNYTRTTGNARCIGWRTDNGNGNEIFWGYLPAVFRELYARRGVCVGNPENYQSADMKNYCPVNWKEFISSLDVDKIINTLSPSAFNSNSSNNIIVFSSAKNSVLSLLQSGNIFSFLCSIWDDLGAIITDEAVRCIVVWILKEIRWKTIEYLKEWRNRKGISKYPRRNCKNCPQANSLKIS